MGRNFGENLGDHDQTSSANQWTEAMADLPEKEFTPHPQPDKGALQNVQMLAKVEPNDGEVLRGDELYNTGEPSPSFVFSAHDIAKFPELKTSNASNIASIINKISFSIDKLNLCSRLESQGINIDTDEILYEALGYYRENYHTMDPSTRQTIASLHTEQYDDGREYLVYDTLSAYEATNITDQDKELVKRANFANSGINLSPDQIGNPYSPNARIEQALRDFIGGPSDKWEQSDIEGKMALANNLLDSLAPALGITSHCQIDFVDDSALGVMGKCLIDDTNSANLEQSIMVNLAFCNNRFLAVNTIAHEMMHARQREKTIHPQNDLDWAYWKNFQYYQPATDVGWEFYHDQPIEEEAFRFGEQIEQYYRKMEQMQNSTMRETDLDTINSDSATPQVSLASPGASLYHDSAISAAQVAPSRRQARRREAVNPLLHPPERTHRSSRYDDKVIKEKRKWYEKIFKHH